MQTDDVPAVPPPSLGSTVSDTPLTDAMLRFDGIPVQSVYADFARELERENARLRKAIRACVRDFEKTKWGWDGPCGTDNVIALLEDSLQNASMTDLQHKQTDANG